jgi:Xaa-Pro aminopeptidase/Xaa-Pro dipeptidase
MITIDGLDPGDRMSAAGRVVVPEAAMSAPPMGLDAEVRQYRLALMQRFMKENSCEALAFLTPDWFEWAGNHSVRESAWERPFLLLVTASGRAIGFLSEQTRHHAAASRARGSLWLDRLVFFAETPAARGRGWTTPDWAKMVASVLTEEGLGSARILADVGSAPWQGAVALLPGVRAGSAGTALRALRRVKHSGEIRAMREAASLSDWAMRQFRTDLRPGCNLAATDYQVAAKLSLEAAGRVPGSDYLIGSITTLSGAASACPKGDGASCGKSLQQDTVAVTTVATKLNGVSMELARTWLIGQPAREVYRYLQIVTEAQQAACDAILPGRPASSVHAAAQAVFDKHGIGTELVLRAGHGVGVTLHDFPEDLPFNDRPLVENEVLAIEPGAYIGGLGGFRFADTVVVRPAGAEHLTRFPKDLDTISIR